MTGAREATIRFPEARVHVREVGEGRPLLLINGLGAYTAMWGTLEERALDGFRIIEFDLPGAGRSEAPWRPVSVPRLARLVNSVMDRFGMDRADILGYSMGGMVAQQLAADAPERVRRLVLVASTPGLGGMQGDLKAMLNIAVPLRYLSSRLYVRTMGAVAGGRARHDGAWIAEQAAMRLQRPPSWRGYLGQLLSIAPWTGLPLLPRIHHPVLVVTGDDDPLTPIVNGKLLAHLLPQGRLLVCEGEGHLMVLDAESRAHPAIRGFLTAEHLEQARVWNEASAVDPAELQRALAGAPLQVPPWNVVSGLLRRRWVPAA